MGIFKNVKNAALRKLMTSQMKKQGADPAQIKLLNELLESNPDLFETIAKEIETRVKNGEKQHDAAEAVMMKHQGELQKVMMKNPAMMQKARLEALKYARTKNKK